MDPYGCFAKASSLYRRKYGDEKCLAASEACTDDEKQFLTDVRADPNDDCDVREKTDRILKILESHG